MWLPSRGPSFTAHPSPLRISAGVV
jgi:hypothetical protein